MREIPITRSTTCGCCRRPVKLLETVRSVTLIEVTRLGDVEVQTPHSCPDQAVRRWDRLAALARMARRARPQTDSPGPGATPPRPSRSPGSDGD